MPLTVTNLSGFGGVNRSPFALDYISRNDAGTDLGTVYTFNNQNIGADVEGIDKRYTVVLVGEVEGNAATISSVTCDGDTMTEVVKNPTDQQAGAGIFIHETTGDGTTANIVVNMDENTYAVGIAVYRLINPSSPTAYDTGSDFVPSSGLVDLNLNVPANGKAVAVAMTASGSSFSWSGATERFDVDIGNGDDFFSVADTTTEGSPRSITATSTGASDVGGVSASWR